MDCPRQNRGQKKARLRGGLNPYQRRHGGDRCNYSESVSALQHFRRENKDFPSNTHSRSLVFIRPLHVYPVEHLAERGPEQLSGSVCKRASQARRAQMCERPAL
ncbi:hypothetical protein GEM_0221 [Burkholderia cepacia GG4]|uniref:Uncharacterized protein n=1 Tax=Burkholderia cepacia GG4 TaxID=1009846 RepID=A0A9W3P7U3_BURCE|nr:hypothetical protein GEM_0221 [Burkholderia cepacia GG4]